jgi:hypothetical protein
MDLLTCGGHSVELWLLGTSRDAGRARYRPDSQRVATMFRIVQHRCRQGAGNCKQGAVSSSRPGEPAQWSVRATITGKVRVTKAMNTGVKVTSAARTHVGRGGMSSLACGAQAGHAQWVPRGCRRATDPWGGAASTASTMTRDSHRTGFGSCRECPRDHFESAVSTRATVPAPNRANVHQVESLGASCEP